MILIFNIACRDVFQNGHEDLRSDSDERSWLRNREQKLWLSKVWIGWIDLTYI